MHELAVESELMSCPFCTIPEERVVEQSDLVYVIRDA
jgi:hypothetical protein